RPSPAAAPGGGDAGAPWGTLRPPDLGGCAPRRGERAGTDDPRPEHRRRELVPGILRASAALSRLGRGPRGTHRRGGGRHPARWAGSDQVTPHPARAGRGEGSAPRLGPLVPRGRATG